MQRREVLASLGLALIAPAAARAQRTAQTQAAHGVASPTGISAKDELWSWTATDLAAAIRNRKISSREATASCLARLAQVNPEVNAVVEVYGDEALAAADLADRAVKNGGPAGRLLGVPVTAKMNTDLRGHATTNGVVAFKNNIASEDSSAVRNFRRDGAIIIGRTNCPAFSFRWFTDNDLYGRTVNPWDPSVTPGGSSGGAAAAVAVGIGPLAQGTDIAGSVRYPAYACGVPGIRPSLGRASGFNPSAASQLRGITTQLMSMQGLFARQVRDLRLGLATLAERDVRDVWWVPAPLSYGTPSRPFKVALVNKLDGLAIDPAMLEGLRRAAKALENRGYIVEEATPPHFVEAAELWSPLVITEARVGFVPLIEKYGDAKVKTEIASWLEITPPLDLAGFSKALGRREQILRDWSLFLQDYPVIVTPCSLARPFPIDLDQQGPQAMRDIIHAQTPMLAVPVLGLPGLTVPAGIVDGLPTGVQVVADRFREDLCFDAGEVIEEANPMGTPIDPRTKRLESSQGEHRE